MLRFPEFLDAGDWENKKFGEMCKFVRGPFGGALKKDIFVKDGYAVYEQSHAIYQNFDSFRYFIAEEKYNELKRFSVRPNDIKMSCSGTMGKFAVIPKEPKKGVINQALLKLTVNNGYNLDFVKFTLELPINQEKLLSQSAGGAIKNVVGVGEMKEIEMSIPSFNEQQKIAACLSSLDELITAQDQKLATLKAHKKGLMQQLFPAEGETVPKLRFPEFRDAGDWGERQLSQLTTKISDGIHTTPVYDENGEYAFINGNNLVNGRILIDEKTKRVDFGEFNKHQKPLDDNSILMSINGTIGNLAFFRSEQVILGKSACFINIDSRLANKFFIYNMLQTDKVKHFFTSELTGSTIKNLSLATIKNIELKVPALPEQQKIADCLSSLDYLITTQAQKLAALKAHKKGLMQQLFPAVDEVAE